MTSMLAFKSLVTPNIFDAYATPNLLLYLVASNLLSVRTGSRWFDAALGAPVLAPCEPILLELC